MSATNGTIVFHEHFAAPLPAGTYDVTIQQRVTSNASNAFDETFEHRLTFAVQGARFALKPEAIQSQFPPADVQGDYANVLPHIVFHPRTLPWQRDIGTQSSDGGLIPWLALFTFDLNDPIPQVEHGTVADLLPSGLPQGTISYPNLQLEYGESGTDPILYIDVPASIFTSVAPTVTELRWLAHARVIDLETASRKRDSADGTVATQFSVVVSNRLPTPGNRTACHLVSLESMEPYLPPNALPEGTTNVRLALLSFWEFGCVAQEQTFREALVNLNRTPGTLQIPYATYNASTNDVVKNAFAMGYSAFDHHTRQGARTVSWYRGPLLPAVTRETVTVPISSSDALTLYDPATGMFDMSLGVAWQIGQLIALADKDFSALLYDWKRASTAEAVLELERRFLGEQIGVDLSRVEGRLHVELMRRYIKPLLGKMLAAQPDDEGGAVVAGPDRAATKRRWSTSEAFLARRRDVLATVSDEQLPAEIRITEWLARLRNLQGVPFYVLIPDVRMLPQESIRMFRIDENWIDCLIDGAFSIGRATTGDAVESKLFARLKARVRQRAATQRVRRYFGAETERAVTEASEVETGFLMRSAVVAGWPTLEVRGYDASGGELRVIRLDRPASDLLFALFDGQVAKVSLSEPVETLHFGFTETMTKNLKYVDATGHAPGSQMDGVSVDVPLRDASRRVVAVDSLASTVEQSLVANGGMTPATEYTTAEFALELVQGVQQVDFTVGEPS